MLICNCFRRFSLDLSRQWARPGEFWSHFGIPRGSLYPFCPFFYRDRKKNELPNGSYCFLWFRQHETAIIQGEEVLQKIIGTAPRRHQVGTFRVQMFPGDLRARHIYIYKYILLIS